MCWRFRAMLNESRQLGWPLLLVSLLAWTNAAAAAQTTLQSFDCVIDPSETAKLGSPVAGILAKVLVGRGDTVTQGETVAEIESQVEAANVAFDQARANSTARIDAQKLRFNLANTRLERADEGYSHGVFTQDKHDEMTADAGIAKQDLLHEEQDQKLAILDLARSQASLDQRTIRSPIDGIITEKKLSAGEFVNQESYVVSVARLDPLYVEVYLPVATYGQVGIGTIGTVYPDPPIGGKYPAAVIVVDRVFDPSSGTYGVRLQLANPNRKLPGGQRCKVGFNLALPDQETSGK